MEARRRGEKGRAMRGEGDIGDARATGTTPRGREEQQKWWQQGNRETTREGGQERALGGDTKNQLKIIVEHERGRTMRDEEYRPLSEGVREEENPTHTPPRRVSVES
jgi:hypothetical protein